VRGVPAWLLKGGAVCLTVLATAGSAGYVGSHVRNQAAPLRPSLQPAAGVQGPAGLPGGGVAVTSAQPVTETHVS
jgi:hypothetical protein